MAVNTNFINWQTSSLSPFNDPYEADSPNLRVIRDHLIKEHGGVSLGIHSADNRPIRGGTSYSSHAYGAALDWRWGYHSSFPKAKWMDRSYLEREVIPWLIQYSDELGIQAIHDQGRIWRAYRSHDSNGGWKNYNTGYGPWLHIETTNTEFGDSRSVAARGVPNRVNDLPPRPEPAPVGVTFNPAEGDYGLWPLRQPPFADWPPNTGTTRNHSGDHVRYLQGVILHRAGGAIIVDGWYGDKTAGRVRDLQRFFGLTVDGWVGPQTWGIIHMLATLEEPGSA